MLSRISSARGYQRAPSTVGDLDDTDQPRGPAVSYAPPASRVIAVFCRVRCGLAVRSLGEAVGAVDAQADNQAMITNHRGPVVGPVRVLTLHGTVKVDELLNRCVIRIAGHW